MNEQLTEKEYFEKINQITFTHELIKRLKRELEKISLTIPKKYYHGSNNDNVTGDYLDYCKNLKHCFDCVGEVEDLAYCELCAMKCNDSYDISNAGVGTELCYESHGIVSCSNCKFIYYATQLHDSEYCHYCFSSEHLFGCIGLKHKKYCILNKQYSKEEYEVLTEKIKEQMRGRHEYGEFFETHYSKFPYNQTVAFEYVPLSKKEVVRKGYQWEEKERVAHSDDSDIQCKQCNAAFKLIRHECDFYKKKKLPTPDICYECRHKERFSKRNHRQIYSRKCQKCHQSIKTTYSNEDPNIIYCEDCFIREY